MLSRVNARTISAERILLKPVKKEASEKNEL